MALWIESLSWTLLFSLVQGAVVFSGLWIALRVVPPTSALSRYRLSMASLAVMLVWFVATWWDQFHLLSAAAQLPVCTPEPGTSLRDAVATGCSPAVTAHWYDPLVTSLKSILPWISVVYLAGLAAMLFRLIPAMKNLNALRSQDISPVTDAMEELLQTLKQRLNISAPVHLVFSLRAHVPILIGSLKPMILIPASAITHLSTEQLETIILHELAHIKRNDYLVNILQTIVETLLFFNPFVWLISKVIRTEREHCCDDLVLSYSNEPLFYASALAALASQPATHPGLALAATGSSNQLFNRIQRIMEMKKNTFTYSRVLAVITVVGALACSVIWIAPSFAGSPDAKTAAVTTVNDDVARYLKEKKTRETEQKQLADRLIADGMVNAGKGFVVEKKAGYLFINGNLQPSEIADKYMPIITESSCYIAVNVNNYWYRDLDNNEIGTKKFLPKAMFATPKGDGC
ncbi:MAG: M56 family metallopeptidase [Bacteroidota bacterium]